jgi:hypothetical protein
VPCGLCVCRRRHTMSAWRRCSCPSGTGRFANPRSLGVSLKCSATAVTATSCGSLKVRCSSCRVSGPSPCTYVAGLVRSACMPVIVSMKAPGRLRVVFGGKVRVGHDRRASCFASRFAVTVDFKLLLQVDSGASSPRPVQEQPEGTQVVSVSVAT